MLFKIASQLIDANPKSIHHDYQGREDIVLLDEKLTKLLIEHILSYIDDPASLRDTIKLVIKKFLSFTKAIWFF